VNQFAQRDSLSAKSPRAIAQYLREIGDDEAADRIASLSASGQGIGRWFDNDPYLYTGILLGYIPLDVRGNSTPIQDAMTLEPTPSLKGTRIKITLDRFYVQKFPGSGTHSILCEFTGKNQIPGDAEEMRFALSTNANDGSAAPISGAPIFLGVSVGNDGVSFEGRTVNVKSNNDEMLMEALGSDAFKNGLSLLTSAQPALKPFVGLAGSVVKAMVSRNQNRQVYSFKIGLDFAGSSTSARLRLGSYIVVQADVESWDWSSHYWDSSSQTVRRTSDQMPVGFNYMVFGVTEFEGA
jgi:hypothetical protein